MIRTALALVFVWLVGMQPAMAAAPAEDAKVIEEIKGFADKLAGNALEIVKNAETPKADKQKQLEALFRDYVDIPWVARFVLGIHWRKATPEQQQTYLTNYEAFVLKNYTSKLTNYSGQQYKILGARKVDGDGEYLLTMELINVNEPNVMVDYRIRAQQPNGYKIIDIIVEGVSMITTQRSEFGSVVGRNGLDALIDALSKKAAKAS